jgi:hypothetical protein
VPEREDVPPGCRRVGMDENYRMLGREREADFAREAGSRRLAREARERRPEPGNASHGEGRATRRIPLAARIASLLVIPGRRRVSRDAV